MARTRRQASPAGERAQPPSLQPLDGRLVAAVPKGLMRRIERESAAERLGFEEYAGLLLQVGWDATHQIRKPWVTLPPGHLAALKENLRQQRDRRATSARGSKRA